MPRPPADLSDRIKADIPQYLQTDADRDRFTGSVAFSMRVAASILLLITTAFVTLRLLEPEAAKQTASLAPRQKVMPAVARYQTTTSTAAAERQPAAEEVRLDIAQEPVPVPASVPPAAPRVAPVVQVAEADRESDRAASGVEGGTAGGFAEEIPTEARAKAPVAIAEMAPATANEVAAPAPPPPPPSAPPAQVADAAAADTAAKSLTRERRSSRNRAAAAPMPLPAPAPAPDVPPPPADTMTITAAAPLISEAHADDLQLRQKSEVFGISVDPNVFDRVKDALQKGTRPPSASVNVDALINYFAGPPARPPRRGVALEVEASPAPVEAEGDQAILRFTIDTPRIEVGRRESTPPAATDARIEIEFDKKAVANFRRIGTSTPVSPESTLLHNLSVTGLYQLELRPGLKGTQHVATVRLRYRSLTNGKMQVITREVRGSDLAHDWARASRRHRLASLGAVWSESLKGAGSRIDVAKRAEELATQEPKDSRARELANAASATAGGRR
ncbi:MAG: hypothetical protein ACJ74H_11375 [Thermoanaerobaculia bacterium]